MTVSVVLRLVERALASGRLAGEAHLVESGETREIRNADELVAFLQSGGEATAPVETSPRRGGEPC